MDGLPLAVGQIELAVNQPLGAVISKIVGRDILAVDGHQPAANHRKPVEFFHAAVLQRLLERLALLGLHVDDEAVGRVSRRCLAPAADEVGTQQHQQHQRQQADGQGAGLHHGVGGTRRQLPRRQHQPARRGRLVDAGAQHLHGDEARGGEYQHRAGESAHGNQSELQVAAGGQQQRGKAENADAEHQKRRRLEVADIAANHAQRRHLGQLQDRRQAERQQQRQAHAHAEGHRP